MAENNTIVGLFQSSADVNNVLKELDSLGVDTQRVSVMGRENVLRDVDKDTVKEDLGDGAVSGARTGALAGGIVGLIAGLNALLIPGIGPVLTIGTLSSAVGATAVGAGVGAAGGGVLGGLLGLGLSDEEAEAYAEGVKRGGILITVEANGDANEINTIFARNNAVDITTRRKKWKDDGWESFDTKSEWSDDYPQL